MSLKEHFGGTFLPGSIELSVETRQLQAERRAGSEQLDVGNRDSALAMIDSHDATLALFGG